MPKSAGQAVTIARQLLRDWFTLWNLPGASTITVRANPRLRTSRARSILSERTIEIRKGLFSKPESRSFAEALCHEAAHLALDKKQERPRAHGPEWRALMRQAGFEPRATRLGRCRLPRRLHKYRNASAPARWEHLCPVCQMVRVAKRPVPQWRCASCVRAGLPGELVITRKEARP
jgi:predicted SprT family Zn-dependent metalloprotease